MFVINLTHHCVAPLPKGEGRKICLINALIDVTLLGGTRGPALQVCATLMLLCFMYCLFRTAEDVCPYDLCLFCCLVVGIAFRRDARPRPTGLCDIEPIILTLTNYSLFISAATSSFIIHHSSFFSRPYVSCHNIYIYKKWALSV